MKSCHVLARSACAGFLLAALVCPLNLFAESDWDPISTKQMIRRSKYIGVGQLSHFGRYEDGSIRGRLKVRRTIYSGIGEVKRLDFKLASKTVPGETMYWKIGSKGVWFVLRSKDKYSAVNHPACRLDEDQAKEVADDVYAWLEDEYDEAEEEAEDDDEDDSGDGGSGDSSDSSSSIDAYAAMAAAADAASRVPYQDSAAQSARLYEQAMSMLDQAGVQSPFPKNARGGAQQDQLLNQFKQLLGPAADKLGQLLGGQGGLQLAQTGIGQMVTQLIGSTMGSQNPAQSLSQLGPASLPIDNLPGPGGKGSGAGPPGSGSKGGPPGSGSKTGGPGGPPGMSGGGAPSINLPMNMFNNLPTGGSRKDMLNAGIGRMGGGSPQMGRGGPSGSGRKGPGGRGPGGGGPGPRR